MTSKPPDSPGPATPPPRIKAAAPNAVDEEDIAPPISKWFIIALAILNFVISISLLNITKYIYITYNFKHALWLTATHMLMSYVFSAVVIFGFNAVPNRRVLSLQEQVFRVAPFSLLGATSIACGNLALVFLYPSLHEMLQSAAPIWVVLINVLGASKSYNMTAYLMLLPCTVGAALCAYGEASDFRWHGIWISCAAAVARAVKTLVMSKLMAGQEPLDALTLLFYAAPFNMALFLFWSFLREGLEPWVQIWSVPLTGQFWIWINALNAAIFNLSSFLIIKHLGAAMGLILGNLKTPTTIVLSMVLFGNVCTVTQVLGFAMVMFGVYGFKKWGKEADITPAGGQAT